MARRRRPFFRRKRQEGEEYPARPPRKRIHIAKMKQGIFILPSLLTLTSIFFSFYSIINSIKEQFVLAAALILVAGFFDGIDGKVARLTNTTTKFGLELDSLADVISFGVAPAILIYMWALTPTAQIGWVAAFLFVSCGALRLARFNVQSGTIDSKKFNGLPIPAAAVMLSTTVLFFHKLDIDPERFRLALLILTLVLSFLMVSAIKFHAFKEFTLVKENPFMSTVAFVLLLALIAVAPFVVPFILISGYVISGPIMTLIWVLKRKQQTQEQIDVPPETQEPVEQPR